MDISTISQSWNKTTWLFSQELGSFNMGPTPTSAAMVKMLAMGELKVYTFNLKAAAYSMVGVNEFLMKDNVKELAPKLPEMQCCTISKGEVMHIPQGWYVLELATKGPLCYGVRKSFMVDTVDGKSAYKKNKEMFEGDGRDVGKMSDLLKLFTAQ